MRWYFSGLLPLCIMAAIPALAGETGNQTLTLAESLKLAAQHNAGLAASDSEAAAMRYRIPQAGSLPDPTLSLKALNLPTNSFSTTQENMTQLQVGIDQQLPFPGKLALRQQAASLEAAAAASNRDEFRLLLLRNVRIRWWNLAWLDKALQIVARNKALLRNLVGVSEAKYKTGKGLQQDVLLAQLELSRLLEKELSLESERQRQAAALNALLGRDADLPVHLPQQLPTLPPAMPDIAALKQQAQASRPLLVSLQHNAEAADTREALAEKSHYPDFRLGAAYGFRQGINPASGQPRADLASITLSMNLPIYSGSKQDRLVDQRRAEGAGARFRWQDARDQVNAEIDATATELRIARRQLALFEQGILPQSRQTTASMLAGYQVNKVDFLNLVRAQLDEFNNDMRYWQLYAHVQQTRARLAAATGQYDLNGASHE